MLVVLSNVLLDILASVSAMEYSKGDFMVFRGMEIASLILFSTDYILHLWSCVASPDYDGAICGRLKYMTKVLPFLDLVVMCALFVDLTGNAKEVRGFQALRMARMLRLLKLLKAEKSTHSFATIFAVVAIKKNELYATFFLALNLLVISSTTMYYLEHAAQPDKFSDIPSTMWWSVAALTTVGYGDIIPITVAGKLVGSFVAFLRVAFFALPAGILGSGFVEVLQATNTQETDTCAKEDVAVAEQGSGDVQALRKQVNALNKVIGDMQEKQSRMHEQQKNA